MRFDFNEKYVSAFYRLKEASIPALAMEALD